MSEKTYTIREIADALGSSKSTVARLVRDRVDAGSVSYGEYRGHAQMRVNQAGFDQLKALLIASNSSKEANQEANRSDSSAPGSESSASKGFIGEDREIIALLRSQLEAKDRQIDALTAALATAQESLTAAQALHASTAAELRRLTAAQETPQEEREPEEDAKADQTNQARGEEPPPTLGQRLKYLFTGKL